VYSNIVGTLLNLPCRGGRRWDSTPDPAPSPPFGRGRSSHSRSTSHRSSGRSTCCMRQSASWWASGPLLSIPWTLAGSSSRGNPSSVSKARAPNRSMQTVWLNPPRCVIDSEARSSSRAVRSGADLAVATDRGCLAMAAGRFTSTCIGVGGAISHSASFIWRRLPRQVRHHR